MAGVHDNSIVEALLRAQERGPLDPDHERELLAEILNAPITGESETAAKS